MANISINSIDALVDFLHKVVPNFEYKVNGEYSSKSPFRESGTWHGDDGFLWFFHAPEIKIWDRKLGGSSFSLRECWHSLPIPDIETIQIGWESINAQLETFENRVARSRLIRFSDRDVIQKYHANVQRDYWYSRGLSDEIIDGFFLGYGLLSYYQYPRHIIPVPLAERPGLYSIMSRRALPEDPARHYRPANSPTTYWYSDLLSSEKSTVYIVEGGIAFLAAIQMGFTPCITTNHGATKWSEKWTDSLLKQHPEINHIVFLGDNDPIGETHVKVIAKSFLTVSKRINRQLSMAKLVWDEDTPSAYDPADVLQYMGLELGRQWLIERIFDAPEEELWPRKQHNSYTITTDHPVNHVSPQTVDLSIVRSPNDIRGIQGGIDYYLNNFDSTTKGKIYLSAFPAGSGKNYALVNVLQERARQHLRKVTQQESLRRQRAQEIFSELTLDDPDYDEKLKHAERLRKPISRKLAVIASPFRESYLDMTNSHDNFDPSLWFYFDSRNSDNCKNIDKANKAAALGYNVSYSVCQTCPFKQECKQSGYLSQFDTMEQYPLVSIRHQHLPIEDITRANLLFIDEYPGDAIFSSQMLNLSATDLRLPRGWEEWIEHKNIEPIRMFSQILQIAVMEGAFTGRRRSVLQGRDLWDCLNKIALETFQVSITYVVNSLDPHDIKRATLTEVDDIEVIRMDEWKAYLNPSLEDVEVDSLPTRCLDIIYEIALHEVGLYAQDSQSVADWNGRIFLFGRQMVVKPMKPLKTPNNTPVVITDAYPNEDMYQKLFPDRELMLYSPAVRNPDTQTTILYGNGFGISEMRKNLSMRKPTHMLDPNKGVDGHPNLYLKYSVDCIRKLLLQHADLLVITHKPVVQYLRSIFTDGRVEFNNYRGIRGLNKYQSHTAVLLIGIPRKPETALEMDLRAWFWQDPVPLLFENKVEYLETYHNFYEDGAGAGFKILSYADDRVHRAFINDITSELKQSASRIRPHTSGLPKYVYMLGSFPALEWVTNTCYYQQYVYNTPSSKDIKEFGILWMEEQLKKSRRLPGQNRFADALRSEGKFSLSNQMARDLHKEIINHIKQK